jgi:hypothetical protein
MRTPVDRRLLGVWALLVAITLGFLGLDHAAGGRGVPSPATAVTLAAVGLALVKVRIIVRQFMEVRHAPPLLCRLTDLWVAVMAVALFGVYLAGRAVAG